MPRDPRPLAGLRVGVSVSGNRDELERRGFTPAGMNRFTVRLSRALLAEGATLAFGHDWRPDGIMEAIAALALDYHPPLEESDEPPAILNLVPWPSDRSRVPPELLVRLRGTVEVRRGGLPEDLPADRAEAARRDLRSDEARYIRARALTHLRLELERACHARVAVGGKLHGYRGRLPGIVEEAVHALRAPHPLYLPGLLGGAAALLGRVILDGEDPDALFEGARLEDLYRRHDRRLGVGSSDPFLAPNALRQFLRSSEAAERLLANGLTEDENRHLLETPLEEVVVTLVLQGLKRVRRAQTDQGA